MATSAYRTWVAAGRPWTLARPIAQLRTWAFVNDVDVLGTIGNEDHLQANFPEDHTPFSFTAWPVPLPGYWVCAIDLADVRGLGAAILAAARAGELPWLKYMNAAGRNYAYADKFRQGAPNSDQHIHLSVFSDDLHTDIGNFDPWGVDMTPAELLATKVDMVDEKTGKRWSFGEVARRDSISLEGALGATTGTYYKLLWELQPQVNAIEARLDALAESLEGIVPGVAEACAQAAAGVTAAAVADELEVRAKGS